jgi:hypothetical protein
MEKQNTTRKADAIQVDWIILIASAIGLAVVIAASVQAGEDGLAANLMSYVVPETSPS